MPDKILQNAVQLTAMREEKNLMVPKGAELPQVCIKCGAPGVPHPYKFAWLSPGYFILFYFGILPYFLVRLFVRKTVKLLVPLCEKHHRLAKNLGVAGMVVLLAAIPAGFGLSYVLAEPDGFAWGFFCSFFLVVFGLILVWAHYPLRAVRIDNNAALFKGACESFLELLPVRDKFSARFDTD